jgi:hypothetical protein
MLTLRIIFLVLTCAVSNVAIASTTPGDRQQSDVQWLKKAADAHFADTGQYPKTDATSTWFQKLVGANYIQIDNLKCGTPPDLPLPIDVFGQALVYELQTPTMPNSAVVRCIGRDGIDSHGAGDDLDSRYGPNFGYWNKSAWPRFFKYLFGGLLSATAASIIVWLIWRRAATSFAILFLAVGTVVGIIVAAQFGAGFFSTSAARLPGWGNAVCTWSCFGVPVGLGIVLWLTIGVIVHRRRRFEHGLCPNCAYPIGTSVVCTECGIRLASVRWQ